jgi:hypothetical protein
VVAVARSGFLLLLLNQHNRDDAPQPELKCSSASSFEHFSPRKSSLYPSNSRQYEPRAGLETGQPSSCQFIQGASTSLE